MSSPDDFTDDQLVEKYIELRNTRDKMTADFAETLKPITEGMTLIENVFLGRLNDRKAQNTRTEHGTAFKVKHLAVKVKDANAFLRYTLENWQQGGVDLLHVGASKKAVQDFLDQHEGTPPPGLETSSETVVNIRKA